MSCRFPVLWPGQLAVALVRLGLWRPSALIERIGLISVATPGACLPTGTPSIARCPVLWYPPDCPRFAQIVVVRCSSVIRFALQASNGSTLVRVSHRPRGRKALSSGQRIILGEQSVWGLIAEVSRCVNRSGFTGGEEHQRCPAGGGTEPESGFEHVDDSI